MEKVLCQNTTLIGSLFKKIFKIGVISLTFFIFYAANVDAAVLSVSPAGGTFKVGDRITLKIIVSSGTPINAISSTVFIPTDLFLVESVSKGGSILDFWVTEPSFSSSNNLIQFEGVALGGFQSGVGSLVTVNLKAIKEGVGDVLFKSGQVLANDGQGTDVTGNMTGGKFVIVARPPESKPKSESEIKKEPEFLQTKPTLEPPVIAYAKKFGEPAIKGSSIYKNSQVLLTFVSESGVKIFITGNTDEKGEFFISVPQTLKRGKYKVYAIVIKKDTSYSFTSNEITIKVGSILSDLSLEMQVLLLFLILVLIYLIIRAYIYLQKNKKLKFFVKKEAKEARSILHESFKELDNKIHDISDEGGRDTRLDINKIRKDLDKVEDRIDKEIKDIES